MCQAIGILVELLYAVTFFKKIMILQKACETFATKIKDNVRNKNNLKSQMSFLPLILLIITASVEYPL